MESVRDMPDVFWAVGWAVLGLAFAAYAARRAWVQHRIARRELLATRRYEELREGEYASIGGTAAKGADGFDVMMEGIRVRVEHARVDGGPRADEIIAVEADRPVYVSGIVERAAGGGLAIRAVPGRRMDVASRPLWQRAARRRVAHAVVAFAVAMGTVEAFRFLAWDALRLTIGGAAINATLSNAREIEEERFNLRDLEFRKVRRFRLDAEYMERGGATRRFTTVVDPDTEWLWSLTADQAEVRRLGIEPVVQPFVVLPRDPQVHQLGERVRLDAGAGLAPLAALTVLAIPYWLLLARPELRRPGRRRLGRVVAPPGPAA